MVEFHDNAILLSSRPFGEDAAVVQVLTASHGRYAGLVRGGQSRRTRPILQPGNIVRVAWRARLDEHLGRWRWNWKRLMRHKCWMTACV